MRQHLIAHLFTPAFAARLQSLAAAAQACAIKEAILARFEEAPSAVRGMARCEADDGELRTARELCDFRMPLMNGASVPMGLPYDWYYGVGDGHLGGEAPAFIVPRIAFSGTLARAFRRTGDPAFCRALHAYVMDYVSRYWVDSSDLPARDNWLCTSCRGGTWYDDRFGGLFAALHDPGLLACYSCDDLLAVFRAIDRMMTGLIPNLALGSNWRVHELANLFTQGYFYPFLGRAAAWRELAAAGLNEEFEVQFHGDGSHEELCVEYGTGTWAVFARFFALAAQTSDTGLSFDAAAMRRSLEYFLSARKPFGLAAAIGDAYTIRSLAMLDPDARPHPADRPPLWDVSLRVGAACLAAAEAADATPSSRSDMQRSGAGAASTVPHPASSGNATFPEARFILRGAPAPAWQSRFHRVSGHLFMRDGWGPDSLYANLNMGWYANCHCHYGLLGVEVAGFGREFIVDAGCSALDDRPVNANFARTRSHNTLCVDGLDQQVAVPVQPSRLFTGDRYDFAVGVYKGGYTQGNPYGPGCTSAGRFDNCFSGSHFRHLLFVKGSYWIVFDALSTRPGHVAETRFQLMPNAMKALPGGGYCTGWREANLALLPLHWEGWERALHQGEEDPIEGWLPAPGGGMVAAPVYKATCATDRAPLWHGTLLFPYREAEMPAVRVTPLPTGDAGFGYRIETDAYTDCLFLSNSWLPRPVSFDGVASDAPLLHVRLADGRPVQGFACEGSYLTISGREIFRAPGTMLARAFMFDAEGRAHCVIRNPRYKRGG